MDSGMRWDGGVGWVVGVVVRLLGPGLRAWCVVCAVGVLGLKRAADLAVGTTASGVLHCVDFAESGVGVCSGEGRVCRRI